MLQEGRGETERDKEAERNGASEKKKIQSGEGANLKLSVPRVCYKI